MAAHADPLLMTVEQFDDLPERQDVLEELHWGLLVALPRPKVRHVKLQMKLTQFLEPLAARRGYVVMELPFQAVSEYDLRAADVAFVSKARWDEANEGYLSGAPELVVEIPSRSNTNEHLREYAALCLANGSHEFWVVDKKTSSVTVTNQSGQSVVYSTGMEVPISVLGGSNVSVDQIVS
jgi:Uma2 family endonuclease